MRDSKGRRNLAKLTKAELVERLAALRERVDALEDAAPPGGESRYRELLEGSDLGVQIVDAEGRRLYVNPALVQMMRYETPEELLAMPPSILVAESDREFLKNYRLKALQGKETPKSYEFNGVRKDGSVVPIQVFFRPVTWNGQEALERIFIDISECKQAEAELRASEERYRALVENVPEIIFVHHHGRMVFANPAAVEFFGKDTVEETLGLDPLEFVHPDDREIVFRRRAVVGSGRSPKNLALLRYDFPDRRRAFIESTSAPVTWGGAQARIVMARDVSDRVRAEEALKFSEANLVEAQRIARIGSWERDFVTGEARYSDEFLHILGVGRETYGDSFENLLSLTHPDDRELLTKNHGAAMERGKPIDLVYRIVRPDGTIRHVHSRAEITLDDDGRPVRLAGAFEDITERLESERALRRLAAIVETSADAIIAIALDQTITDWNAAAERMYGYSPGEAIGQPVTMTVPPERQSVARSNVDAILSGGQIGSRETIRRRKDGSLFNVSLTFSPIRDETGKILGLSAIHRDITEQNRAQSALRASEAQMRLMIDAMPASIAFIDREHRVRIANRPYAEWHGIAEADIIGMHLRDVRGREAYEKFLPEMAQALSGETLFREGEREFRDGSTRQYRTTMVPNTGEDGNISGYFAIVVDMTEELEREAQLRQSQKMEALGQLTGGIAHEFNNLLMVVVGNIEMLGDRVGSDAELGGFVDLAMKGAMRGAELTRQLLTFSRKQTLDSMPLDLNKLVIDMQGLLQRTLGETISVQTEIADDLWSTISDSGEIESALLNFALNARDAMPGGGTITVRTVNRTVNAAAAGQFDVPPGDYVMLEVADTGTGMPPEVAQRIFDPFFTTKEVGKGTGLGLSMVYGFARQSGGFVDIESAVGQGTAMRVCLPRAAGDAPDQTAGGLASRHRLGGGTVLVVEDDPDVRDLIVRILSELGYATIEAEDGRTALAKIDESPEIDLLFTDVILPGGMSGPDIAREARQRRPGIKIVLTSGYPEQEIAEMQWDGVSPRIIRKPYQIAELVELLAEIMPADD